MDYELIRSSRKTISITINPSGRVVVRAPYSTADSKIAEFVNSKADWIRKHTQNSDTINDKRHENLSSPPKELPILGEMRPVEHSQPYGYINGKFNLPTGLTLEELLPYLRKLYMNIAKDVLISRTKLTADRMGIEIADVKVNSAKTRWGSCSSKKVINLSWKLITAEPKLIEYVIVHELCHTRQMNHSAAFWANVEAVIPDYLSRRAALKDVQKMLSEYGLE